MINKAELKFLKRKCKLKLREQNMSLRLTPNVFLQVNLQQYVFNTNVSDLNYWMHFRRRQRNCFYFVEIDYHGLFLSVGELDCRFHTRSWDRLQPSVCRNKVINQREKNVRCCPSPWLFVDWNAWLFIDSTFFAVFTWQRSFWIDGIHSDLISKWISDNTFIARTRARAHTHKHTQSHTYSTHIYVFSGGSM